LRSLVSASSRQPTPTRVKEPARARRRPSSIGAVKTERAEEVGGIVPHITLKSIANNEPADEEILVDRLKLRNSITRVSGPFTVEATIPMPINFGGEGGGE